MIKSIEEAKEIAEMYNAIQKDKYRLAFLREQKGNLKVVLDNDLTMVEFDQIADGVNKEEVYDISLNYFNDYHGWTGAVIELFEFAGITAETC